MKRTIIYSVLVVLLTCGIKAFASEPLLNADSREEIISEQKADEETQSKGQNENFQPKEVIFKHLGDEYEWHVGGKNKISLPVIVRDHTGKWHVFSSAHLDNGNKHEGFHIAHEGDFENKIVGEDDLGNLYRPLDFSVTRNAMSIVLTALLTMWLAFALVRFYKRCQMKAPRKGMGFIEMIVVMLYDEVIVDILGEDAKRFASYLLTLFFFIFIANLVGMIAVFPGGANITGNLSITLVLALCTFVVVNVSGTKTYWKETFWPDVPIWLKFPLPIMPLIEVFGIFTKPAALMIRLFANMLGGHLILIILISLIFLFGTMGSIVLGATTVFSVFFAVFMDLIHVLIAFIQAYVFMMLSTLFIGLARVKKSENE